MATKKQIICPNCKAKLKFDPDKIVSEVVKFKCPGCGAVLRIRKPESPKEPSPVPSAIPTELKTDTSPVQPQTENPEGSTAGIKDDQEKGEQAEGAKEEETAHAEKITADLSSAQPPPPGEEHGPLIPEEELVVPKPAGESLLEEYDHEKLREYEEGEAEEGDLEWTRYADKKGPQLPESKIDLNVIPASETELQETLADLQQAEVYNLQGEANLGKHLVKQAIRDFNHALEINPNFVDALVNRGSAYALQNQFNDALSDFNHALDLEKREAEIYKIRGEIYLVNKMYDQAIKDFTSAILLNPMYSDAYLNRARAYSEKGMREEAESDFNEAIKADPDKFSNVVDLYGSEDIFAEEGASKKEAAAKYFQQGVEDLKNEKYSEALENLTQAINLSPDEAQAYVIRGQAYIEIDQPDEAMVDLNRAVRIDPLNPAAYYWRAMTWKALNSPINMVADFKVACELGDERACIEYESHKPQKH